MKIKILITLMLVSVMLKAQTNLSTGDAEITGNDSFLSLGISNTNSSGSAGIKFGTASLAYDKGSNVYHYGPSNTFFIENAGDPNSKFVLRLRNAAGTTFDALKVNQDGNFGIGVSNVYSKLQIETEGAYKSTAWFGKAFINNSNYHFDRARLGISGTSDSGQFGAGIHFQTRNLNNTNYLHAIIGENRYGSIIFETGGAGVNAPTGKMTILNNGNVGIGTTSPDSKLAVNGKIHAKEVKVNLIGWSDFVFYDNYSLPTLIEVEKHIKEKGHLKDIPSAKEVAENGIFLGEMDAKLLQKIEELTLYTIEQEKKIKKQEQEVLMLKSQTAEIAELKLLVKKLLESKN